MRRLFREGWVKRPISPWSVASRPRIASVTLPLLPAPGQDRRRRMIVAETPAQVYNPRRLMPRPSLWCWRAAMAWP